MVRSAFPSLWEEWWTRVGVIGSSEILANHVFTTETLKVI